MRKSQIIKRITSILNEFGCFDISELRLSGEDVDSPCVGVLGPIAGFADYLTEDYCEINVYDTESSSSDSIQTYEEEYNNLSKDVLEQILGICELWETECLKTENE
jgi:hypothetical protein